MRTLRTEYNGRFSRQRAFVQKSVRLGRRGINHGGSTRHKEYDTKVINKHPKQDSEDQRHDAGFDLRGMRKFALTLSNKSSRVAFSLGKRPLCEGLISGCPWLSFATCTIISNSTRNPENIPRATIFSFHLLSISQDLSWSACFSGFQI